MLADCFVLSASRDLSLSSQVDQMQIYTSSVSSLLSTGSRRLMAICVLWFSSLFSQHSTRDEPEQREKAEGLGWTIASGNGEEEKVRVATSAD